MKIIFFLFFLVFEIIDFTQKFQNLFIINKILF